MQCTARAAGPVPLRMASARVGMGYLGAPVPGTDRSVEPIPGYRHRCGALLASPWAVAPVGPTALEASLTGIDWLMIGLGVGLPLAAIGAGLLLGHLLCKRLGI